MLIMMSEDIITVIQHYTAAPKSKLFDNQLRLITRFMQALLGNGWLTD